jgi:phosphatidylglycerol lysyltransferase
VSGERGREAGAVSSAVVEPAPTVGVSPAGRARLSWDRVWPFVAAAAFTLAIVLLHRELAAYSYHAVMRAAGAVPAARLALALGFTALSYAVLPGYDAMALSSIGHPLPLRRTVFGSFIAYAFGQTLGFPLVTGGSIRYRLWSAWGLSSTEIARAVGFVAFSFVLGMVLLSGVVFVAEPGRTAQILALPAAVLRPLGVLELALVAGYVGWSLSGRGTLVLLGRRLPSPQPGIVGAQLLVPALDWTFAAAALYVVLPPAHGLPFFSFLGVFLVAQFAGLASHVPGGLGVVETLMVVVLKPWIPPSELLGALVVYRLVYYFIPFGVAVVLIGARELHPYAPQALGVAKTIGGWVPRLVAPVLSGAVFVTGAVLLVSGATPGVPSRLAWLGRFLPLSLIEASHFVGSLAGAGLLVLAWALWHRLDAAWGLTVALLATGIGASLLKGVDWEEASILTLVLVAVLPARRYFYRRAAIAATPLEPGWVLAILVVVGGSIWLGVFAHKHGRYSSEIWWRFALDANAPRFLRATVGVVSALFLAGLFRLFRHAPVEPALPGPAELDHAAALVERSSSTSAWLALLGDKALMFSPSGDGFLMYGIEGRSWVALGDPVGPPADQAELAWEFRDLCDRHGGWTVFYEVGVEQLPLYIDLGLTLLKLGEEARVPLSDFSLDGPNRRALRRTQRQMERDGVTFELVPVAQVAPLLPELRGVSDAWLESKQTREKGFSLGRFDEGYLRRFPLALARQGGRIVAFANIWTTRTRTELSVDLMRYLPEAPGGVMQFLFTELMLWGRAEGYEFFRLGMAPFSGMERRALAPVWSKLGAFMYRHGEHFYNFQGLREYKDKFEPVWEPRYLASPAGLALPTILANIAALIGGGIRGVVGK